MNPDISIITIAVRDLTQALVFYRDGLGWESWSHPSVSPPDSDDHAGFKLQGGATFVIYKRKAMQQDTKELDLPRGSTEVMLTLAVKSRAEVGELLKRAAAAGGKIVSQPAEQSWGGYSGSFRDLDGHFWDVMLA